jgi:hypothetical protein
MELDGERFRFVLLPVRGVVLQVHAGDALSCREEDEPPLDAREHVPDLMEARGGTTLYPTPPALADVEQRAPGPLSRGDIDLIHDELVLRSPEERAPGLRGRPSVLKRGEGGKGQGRLQRSGDGTLAQCLAIADGDAVSRG